MFLWKYGSFYSVSSERRGNDFYLGILATKMFRLIKLLKLINVLARTLMFYINIQEQGRIWGVGVGKGHSLIFRRVSFLEVF